MINQHDILSLIESNRNAIKNFGVREFGIFGSVARGDNTAESDVDFVVEFEKETFSAYMGLLLFLEELVGKKVDLVMKDSIKPVIKERILAETIYVKGF